MKDICRLCLNLLTNKTGISIYNCDTDDVKLYLKINDVGGIFIPEKDESLPNFICMECCENVNKSYTFRNLCQSSDEQLKRSLSIKTESVVPIKDCDSDSENFFNHSNGSSPIYAEDCDSDLKENHNAENCSIEICEERLEENLSTEKTIGGKRYYRKRNFQNEKHQSKLVSMKESAEENLEITRNQIKESHSFICEICGKVFDKKYKFRNHKLLHIGVKLYKCVICDKEFHSKFQVDSHMRVHTGEKPYQCSYCEKCFSHHSSKKQHEKTHTNERPYPCTFCDKRFRKKNAQTCHIRIHTGERPYCCEICNLSFIKKYHIDRHYRSQSHQKLLKEKE